MDLTAKFANALKRYREAMGLSQEEFAENSGLDRTYVSQLERKLKSPTLTSIEKIAECLGVEPDQLLKAARAATKPRFPDDYVVNPIDHVSILRGTAHIEVSTLSITSAINTAHEMIDDLYETDLDIASTLGMRNLSSFIGELFAAAVRKVADGFFEKNPHQDGYPDLLVMDAMGKKEWAKLESRRKEKTPFSPFSGGGIEVKATCGSVPTPQDSAKRNVVHPGIGDTRISCMKSYDWKAHHRDTNNLIGIFWDFIGGKPRITALFYSNDLVEADWGKIVQPKKGGGRTTSVSIMTRGGIAKMYAGWLCVLKDGGYVRFLNQRNKGTSIPVSNPEKSERPSVSRFAKPS